MPTAHTNPKRYTCQLPLALEGALNDNTPPMNAPDYRLTPEE